jgi:hypothetical protein
MTETKDPLELVNTVKAIKEKAETMKARADDLGRWVDRLNALNNPKSFLQIIEFDRLSPVGMAWMNGNPLFEHDIQMIKDAMINICTTQITLGYKWIQELKDDL